MQDHKDHRRNESQTPQQSHPEPFQESFFFPFLIYGASRAMRQVWGSEIVRFFELRLTNYVDPSLWKVVKDSSILHEFQVEGFIGSDFERVFRHITVKLLLQKIPIPKGITCSSHIVNGQFFARADFLSPGLQEEVDLEGTNSSMKVEELCVCLQYSLISLRIVRPCANSIRIVLTILPTSSARSLRR